MQKFVIILAEDACDLYEESNTLFILHYPSILPAISKTLEPPRELSTSETYHSVEELRLIHALLDYTGYQLNLPGGRFGDIGNTRWD